MLRYTLLCKQRLFWILFSWYGRKKSLDWKSWRFNLGYLWLWFSNKTDPWKKNPCIKEKLNYSFFTGVYKKMSGNHYTEYKYYSSHDLIDKVNRWCSGFYLNSVKFAEMRETLRIRIKLLNNYNRNHAVFEKICI